MHIYIPYVYIVMHKIWTHYKIIYILTTNVSGISEIVNSICVFKSSPYVKNDAQFIPKL